MYAFLFGRLLTWFLGGWDEMMLALVTFVVVEVFSSMLLIISGRSANKDCKQWIAKQITMFLIVGIGNITDRYLTNGDAAFRTIIILFYIGCEGIAILKNAKKLGLVLPESFSKFLMKLCDNEDNDS